MTTDKTRTAEPTTLPGARSSGSPAVVFGLLVLVGRPPIRRADLPGEARPSGGTSRAPAVVTRNGEQDLVVHDDRAVAEWNVTQAGSVFPVTVHAAKRGTRALLPGARLDALLSNVDEIGAELTATRPPERRKC